MVEVLAGERQGCFETLSAARPLVEDLSQDGFFSDLQEQTLDSSDSPRVLAPLFCGLRFAATHCCGPFL